MTRSVKGVHSRQTGDLFAVITRGKNKGTKLYPHNHSAGQIPRCFAMKANFMLIPSRSRPRLS